MSLEPFAWRDRPSLIERLLPSQKISAEAQKERKAGAGQTLTALGSYWKGRKPLILVKACVLGALLPATDDEEADLATFELLMAIDDEAFLRREFRPSPLNLVKRLCASGLMRSADAERLFEVRRRTGAAESFSIGDVEQIENSRSERLAWREEVSIQERSIWEIRWIQSFSYLERVSGAKRPEELDQAKLFAPVWDRVNAHLGTSAVSIPELVEQMGILRFGHRPKVGDTFCGGGSIPFEAARLGCDVYASDLNPIACMLTWGAFHIIGANVEERQHIEEAERSVAEAIDRETTELGIEHDSQGNRAKAYLYCLETRCPQTGWMVPLSPSWVISKNRGVVARLLPNTAARRFEIEVVAATDAEEMRSASIGTVVDGEMVYRLEGETYRTSLKTIRGDYRLPDGGTVNRLRRWERSDFVPRDDDIYQERLYCIQWITKETVGKSRTETFFRQVTDEDLSRERKVEELVKANLTQWQRDGFVPDMTIESGEKTDEPIRTRGWTYWHHLFTARQLHLLGVFHKKALMVPAREYSALAVRLAALTNRQSKLCRLDVNPGPGRDCKLSDTFTNQALNPLLNFGVRASEYMCSAIDPLSTHSLSKASFQVASLAASEVAQSASIWITDPPYADAIRYEEITEYFIAWLRKSPPPEFSEWLWDSRRSLAIKGSGEDFRRDMIAAYQAMSHRMPDNGLQLVMFTHQDAGVWADMAAIVWGAGLRVSAAWYIATETTSELKKGGYVQGTVLLVLRKRVANESVYRDELVQEVRQEVAHQIETMVGLNQAAKGHGRSENLFEDADLQMAGYAAALRVLTGYSSIDGQNMAAEAIRPKQAGVRDIVREIIDFAVQVANEHLVPEGVAVGLWERLTGPERFYLKMLDLEAAGLKKIDNYQNFAKAFRLRDYGNLMASSKANDARLKTALELKRDGFESEFGKSPLRAVLFALYELQKETDIDEAMQHLRDMTPGYLSRREDLIGIANAIASRRSARVPEEAQAARILATRIKNERLG